MKHNTKRFVKDDVDAETKIKALADYLGISEDEVHETWDENNFETDGDGDYIVCDYDTAYNLAIDDVKELYRELGLKSFSDWYQEYIINNFLDDKALQDTMYQDIKEVMDIRGDDEILDEAEMEGLIDEDEIVEEAKKKGLIDEDDEWATIKSIDDISEVVDIDELREKLIDKIYERYEDNPSEYFRDYLDMGDKEFSKWIADNNYIDIDEVAQACIRDDGIGHFIASYDGNEIELDHALYAYRTN